MDGHPVVLEERIETLAVAGSRSDVRREGIGREEHQDQEEDQNAHQSGEDPRLKLGVPASQPPSRKEGVAREQERPPEQRPVLTAPQ